MIGLLSCFKIINSTYHWVHSMSETQCCLIQEVDVVIGKKRHKVYMNMSWLASQIKKKYFSFRLCYIPWLVSNCGCCFGHRFHSREGVIIGNKINTRESVNTCIGLPPRFPMMRQAYFSWHDPSPTDAMIVRNENNAWDVTSEVEIDFFIYHFQHTLRRSFKAGFFAITRSLPKRETST